MLAAETSPIRSHGRRRAGRTVGRRMSARSSSLIAKSSTSDGAGAERINGLKPRRVCRVCEEWHRAGQWFVTRAAHSRGTVNPGFTPTGLAAAR
jgi:hypothetical protein